MNAGLFPSESIVLKSLLSAEDVIIRLKGTIEPTKVFRPVPPDSSHLFEGNVTDYSFRMSQLSYSRGTFAPIIAGAVKSTGGGSTIDIKLKMRKGVRVFLIIFYSIIGFVLLALILSSIIQNHFIVSSYVRILGIIGFLFLLSNITFLLSSRRVKKDLTDLFKAQITDLQQENKHSQWNKIKNVFLLLLAGVAFSGLLVLLAYESWPFK